LSGSKKKSDGRFSAWFFLLCMR